MTVKGMYSSIAEHYPIANLFGSISKSHDVAIEQIKKHLTSDQEALRVLDLGVGRGDFVEKLYQLYPTAAFTGIDISAKMLDLTRQLLPITTIEASAAEASLYLPPDSQDLVLAHFINAYIPLSTLFTQARTITRTKGLYSMITTTYDSFPFAQSKLAEFIAENSLASRVVGHYYKAIVTNATVAAGERELMDTFADNQFEIIEHQRLVIPIELKNIDELIQFGIEGTWFLNSLSIRMLPKNFLLQRLKKLFSHIFTFPYQDSHVIDIVLAKKLA